MQEKDGSVVQYIVAPFGGVDIKVRFPCRKCRTVIESDNDITLERPDFSLETAAESNVFSEDGTATCEKCGEEHVIEVTNSTSGMLIMVDGVKEGNIEFMVTNEYSEPGGDSEGG